MAVKKKQTDVEVLVASLAWLYRFNNERNDAFMKISRQLNARYVALASVSCFFAGLVVGWLL